MIKKAKAKKFAESQLEKLQTDCPVELAFNLDLTEEYSKGFVFYYNSKEFWRTRNFAYSVAGNGPIFVYKNNGETVVLPSNQSVEKSIRELFYVEGEA